ncbi:hypothetical protein NQ317_000593 [Molorchus minor]|uniref:Uncharacterized protein n=1 Tax=Molorchus minor TaxID=1323400 RepID=A0ABQ9J3E1_9CUCU|nr:hypothetical protein NQ317_000593 [Molorchus minor]
MTIPETIRVLPIFPELSRSLKPPCEESIATIPETIRDLSTFPEFSRSLKPSYEESIATVSVAIRELPNLTTATTQIAKRVTAYPLVINRASTKPGLADPVAVAVDSREAPQHTIEIKAITCQFFPYHN